MAGLAAAWKLSNRGFEVTIFEKGPKPGLAAHSVNIEDFLPELDVATAGDVPSRMFNESLWPTVCRLYREAGVEFEPVDHEQTFCLENETLLKIALPYRLLSNVKSIMHTRSRRLMQSISSFREIGQETLQSRKFADSTFEQFLQSLPQSNDTREFLEGFLFPALTSTVFTCPRDDLRRFPCELVLGALEKITDQQTPLMRTVNGSQDAARKLLVNVNEINYETAVEQVLESEDSAKVVVNGEHLRFDHVIVATQANHASRLVSEAMPEESRLLEKFKYVDVPVVLHTDSSVLPENKNDWSTFNFDSKSGTSCCTVWMNRFHSDWPEVANVFHSIFPVSVIDQDRVLSSVVMQRPVVDVHTSGLHHELNQFHARDRRTWFVGSYAVPGVPLLESAAASSSLVVSHLCKRQTDTVVG